MPGRFFMGLAFRNTADAGWVSVYFPLGAGYAVVGSNLDLLNTAEMKCLHTSVTCPRLTVSDVEVPGDVFPVAISTTVGGSTDVTGTADPAFALPVLQIADEKHRATRFLRGLPGGGLVHTDPAYWNPATAVMAFITSYLSQLKDLNQLYSRPGKRNQNTPSIAAIVEAQLKPVKDGFKASIRKAGRPFGLRHGRRATG
jgi:hypothetical protein